MIGKTTGNRIAWLKAAGDITKTARNPCCSRPIVGSSDTR
ncbi:hypothetical protein ACPOL_1517 [Acidisarcina polymorpha]|uniref:Uncharacterized protein n=1 Tax=Acidisarcina polymorpha TaxID=2211140 RepID=A0A2Z5FVE9_9BACT|nr:hypothetical protein ACPOL_1517 [Acidisarcina polymorpha]